MKAIKLLFLFFGMIIISCNPITERLEGFSVHGIDVSHHQGKIQWDSIANQNIHFAFVKATEGGDFVDSMFVKNWDELARLGIKRGAYHFFRADVPAETQAQNFINRVSLSPGDFAPVVDVEVVGKSNTESLQNNLQDWLNIVEDAYGIRPIIYSNQKFFLSYLHPFIDKYPTWVARYNKLAPTISYDQHWDFWQYGDRGKVNGIETDVDLNVFRGNIRELEVFCLPTEMLYSSVLHTTSE